MTKENVILINPFIIEDGKMDEALEMWEKSRDILKDKKGYVSTKLHQALTPDAQFQLINVAEWESMDDFIAAIGEMHNKAGRMPIEGVKGDPKLYKVIRQ